MKRYKPGYSPAEILAELRDGIAITCGRCGGPAEMLPGGPYCPTCSGSPVVRAFLRDVYRTNGGLHPIPDSLRGA